MMKKVVSGIALMLLLSFALTLMFNIRPAESDLEVVFFDDFNDGVADGWTVQLGNFEVVDGEYYTDNGPGQKSIATVDGLTFTDCIVQTNVRLRDTEGGFQAAIILRYTDNYHHYTFSINDEGDCVSFEKYTPAQPHFGILLAVNRSVSISKNTNYLLKVKMQRNTFLCFLDNEEVLTVIDNDYASGQVGLRGQKADAYFDNFTVLIPSSPVITSSVNIRPQTLNLRSRGRWITGYVELSEGYDVGDINVSTLMINETIPAELRPVAIGDYDNDSIPDLMVKFDRSAVVSYILDNANLTKLYEEKFMTITLTVTGKLNDGTPFQGSTAVRIIMPTPRGIGRHKFPI